MEVCNTVAKITLCFSLEILEWEVYSFRTDIICTWKQPAYNSGTRNVLLEIFNDSVTHWSGTFGQIISQFQIWCLSAHQSMQYKTSTFYIVFFSSPTAKCTSIDTMENLAIDPWQNVAVFCGQMIQVSGRRLSAYIEEISWDYGPSLSSRWYENWWLCNGIWSVLL